MDGHLAGPDVTRFDRFARLYERGMPSADRATLERGLSYADRNVGRLLDVGGGTGRAGRALGDYNATVVDAAPGMVRTADESGASGIRGVQGVAERLPVRTASVDAVLVVDALHHFADAGTALRAAARVLRPGGVLVVREFDPSTWRGRALVAAEHAAGLDSRFFTSDDLLEAVREAGLAPFRPERGFAYTVVGVKRRG